MTSESQPCQYHSRCEVAFQNKYGGCLGGLKWISLEGFMESAHGLVCLDWDVIVPEAVKPEEAKLPPLSVLPSDEGAKPKLCDGCTSLGTAETCAYRYGKYCTYTEEGQKQ